jgi:hypothetical protein
MISTRMGQSTSEGLGRDHVLDEFRCTYSALTDCKVQVVGMFPNAAVEEMNW